MLLMLAVGLDAANAQTIGWSHRYGEVQRLDFSLETQTVEAEYIADTGLDGWTAAADLSPDHILIVVVGDELYEVDLESGGSTLLGTVPTADFPADLTVDTLGRIWWVTEGQLYELDPQTAAATPFPIPGETLLNVAAFGEQLIGLRPQATEGAEQFFELVSIDVGTASVDLITTLGPFANSCFFEQPTSMDFDSLGGLWISVGEFVTCITPPPPITRFLYLSDPWSGDPPVTVQPTTPNYLPTLAMDIAPTSLAEIPTLGAMAEITFALLLACVGAWFLVARLR